MGLQAPIALDPGVGGCSISDTALQPADIIVSTTSATVSGVIRVGTHSVVSHAALYAGSGSVIEAIGAGVVSRAIDASLADDVLAVAYRSPKMTAAIAAKIVAFASKQIGTAYSVAGAVMSSDPLACRIAGPRPSTFFCSQLVIEAYRVGGLPLTTSPAQCVTPQDVVDIATRDLTYVGHLKGNTSWFPMISP
jgi:cell wall-associated NlpC family hydrolase